MKGKRILSTGLAMTLVLALMAGLALAQQPAGSPLTAAFTYQGRLNNSGVPYTGACDFQFGLWDAVTGGIQIGPTQTVPNVGLADGYFTVLLDWGADKFFGEQRWLDIYVRCPAGSGTYTPLTPRQMLTASPQALFAMHAPWPGLVDVPPGFADGVDNDTIYGAGAGLTISGTIFSADTTYLQRRVNGVCGSGFAIREVNQDGSVTCEPVGGGGGSAWLLTGNSGTTPGTNYLGTSDNQALELRVNGERVLRLEPNSTSPNLIGGRPGNWLTSGVHGATIGGGGAAGFLNRVTDSYGTVGGGTNNQAGDDTGLTDDAAYATVGGGYDNTARGELSTVGGGVGNVAGDWSTVAGGYQNEASGWHATVGGGNGNTADAWWATVGGGCYNTASGNESTVGGGLENTASDQHATVGGGDGNTASGSRATIGGGIDNTAGGNNATVGGGTTNTASGFESTIAGGQENIASGIASMVPGGVLNNAAGNYSFAAGRRAKANNQGCFVWGDSTAADVTCAYDNRWVARASGGVYFYTDAVTSTGSYLAAGGTSWNVISDRATKENFSPADGQAILETLASLPVQEYNLKSQDDSIRHVGLVAQDFAAFGYGESEKAINLEDADGVAMAAIQALYAQNQALEAQVGSLQQENADMEARLTALEQVVQGGKPAESGSRLPVPWLVAGGLVVAGGGALAGLRRRPGGER